jgi:hypothetical protein
MINASLQNFIDGIAAAQKIEEADVLHLRGVLTDGISCRDEADMLIALDRAVPACCAAWTDFLVQALVEFVVWTSRPTGRVDAETARWLTASLGSGRGPTDLALRIAFETVREADRADESLVAFVLRHTRARTEEVERPQDAGRVYLQA